MSVSVIISVVFTLVTIQKVLRITCLFDDSEFPSKIYYLHMNNKLYLVLGRWFRIVCPRDQILQQKSAKQKQTWLQKWLPRRFLSEMKYNVAFPKQFVRSFQNEAWSAIPMIFSVGHGRRRHLRVTISMLWVSNLRVVIFIPYSK